MGISERALRSGFLASMISRGNYMTKRTRGRGKVLEKTGGQMSVRGTRQRAVIFLLRYFRI